MRDALKMTQQETILNEIRTKGHLNSFYATYGLGIKQAPTRVFELKRAGYDIQARPAKNDSVDWYLGSDAIPNAPEPVEYFFIGDKAIPKQEPVQEALI